MERVLVSFHVSLAEFKDRIWRRGDDIRCREGKFLGNCRNHTLSAIQESTLPCNRSKRGLDGFRETSDFPLPDVSDCGKFFPRGPLKTPKSATTQLYRPQTFSNLGSTTPL